MLKLYDVKIRKISVMNIKLCVMQFEKYPRNPKVLTVIISYSYQIFKRDQYTDIHINFYGNQEIVQIWRLPCHLSGENLFVRNTFIILSLFYCNH